MKALVLTDNEERITIKEVNKSNLRPGQALIRIKAAALNHRDQWCREGKYPGLKYGIILGSDGAGVVETVADEINNSWIGKEVVINPNINWGVNPEVQSKSYHILGMPTHGTFAEYVAVNVDRLQEKPAHLTFSSAAALPLGGLTAYRAIFRYGKVKAGDKVLISGVGGGVAQFAFLFALAQGAEVYVTSGSTGKIETAKERGAKGGFIYKETEWHQYALETTGGFDVVIDSAGGDQLNAFIRILKPTGKMVLYGATTGLPSKLDLHRLFWNQLTIQGTTMGNDQEFKAMVAYVANHKIEPIIDSVRTFAKIKEAFDVMRDGKQTGKLVVEF